MAKFKTPAKQRLAWRKWAAAHPEEEQARKNAWWKTDKGKAATVRRREKFNEYRRKWRAKRRRELARKRRAKKT